MNVFISYHHADSDFARLLKSQLAEEGIDAWLAEINLRAGDNWSEEIDQAIEVAAAMIVIMTRNTPSSEYVTYEWAYAMGRQKRIIPILHDRDPSRKQHPKLDSLQFLNLTQKDAEPWQKLFDSIESSCGQVSSQSEPMLYRPDEVRRVHGNLTADRAKRRTPKPTNKVGDTTDMLIVVDVQKDFFSSGNLPAADAETLLGPLNKAINEARERNFRIVFTRDWHPEDHSSFTTEGGYGHLTAAREQAAPIFMTR